MKKIFFIFITIASLLLGSSIGMDSILITKDYVEDTDIKIIDIRTKGEWKDTGIIEDSYPLTFIDEQGRYNVNEFTRKLNQIVQPNEKFAIICNSGNRTANLYNILKYQYRYKVINLDGGIRKLMRDGYKTESYK